MKRSLGILAMAASLIACGSNQALLLAERSRGEAEQLKEFCQRAGLATDDTRRADAVLISAAKHLKDGDEDQASADSDLAATWYRLALAKRDLAETGSQVETLRQGLAKDKDQLQTYREILSEMKTVRKP